MKHFTFWICFFTYCVAAITLELLKYLLKIPGSHGKNDVFMAGLCSSASTQNWKHTLKCNDCTTLQSSSFPQCSYWMLEWVYLVQKTFTKLFNQYLPPSDESTGRGLIISSAPLAAEIFKLWKYRYSTNCLKISTVLLVNTLWFWAMRKVSLQNEDLDDLVALASAKEFMFLESFENGFIAEKRISWPGDSPDCWCHSFQC